jgi:hypothetical protein
MEVSPPDQPQAVQAKAAPSLMPATSRSQIAFFKIAEWSEVTAAVVRPRRTSLVGKVAKHAVVQSLAMARA